MQRYFSCIIKDLLGHPSYKKKNLRPSAGGRILPSFFLFFLGWGLGVRGRERERVPVVIMQCTASNRKKLSAESISEFYLTIFFLLFVLLVKTNLSLKMCIVTTKVR